MSTLTNLTTFRRERLPCSLMTRGCRTKMTDLKAIQLFLFVLFLVASYTRSHGPDSSMKRLMVCPVNALSGDTSAGLPCAFAASATSHTESHVSGIPTTTQTHNTIISDGLKASEDIPALKQTVDYVLQEFEVLAVKGISWEEAANLHRSTLQLKHTLHQRVAAFTAYADLVFSRLQIATHAGGFDEQIKSYYKTLELFNAKVCFYHRVVGVRLALLDLSLAVSMGERLVSQRVQGNGHRGRGSLLNEGNITRLARRTGQAVANSAHGRVG